MKRDHILGTIVLFALGTFAATCKFWPNAGTHLFAGLEPTTEETSQFIQLTSGDVHDGDTLRVTNGGEEITVRLCGVDAPELEQPLGTAARDHLRSLIAQGDGEGILLKTTTDQHGRTIAEIFLPLVNSEAELHLNSQMIADGMAYINPPYIEGCPNAQAMKIAEDNAQEKSLGVWRSDTTSQSPWLYRQAN